MATLPGETPSHERPGRTAPDAGHRLAEIADDGAIRPAFRRVADSLTARSLRAFSILLPGDTRPCAP
jgi:hypothetical protein